MNRKEYFAKLNEVNTKYHEAKLMLEKMPFNERFIERLNGIRRQHETTLKAQLNDDLVQLNDGKEIRIK